MAKIRPARAGRRKAKFSSWAKGLPCLFVLLGIFIILVILFTAVLSSGVK